MADDDAPNEEQPPARERGTMRFQDPDSAVPREPTLAEQRARRRVLMQELEREEAAEAKSEARRKAMIGGGVTVGLVGLVAAFYGVAVPDDVTAVCTDEAATVVSQDEYCDENYVTSQGGYHSGGFLFLPLPSGGYRQYRYNYGGAGAPGTQVSGGTFTKPANANIRTPSGKTVQRGGFGIKSGGFGGFGKGGGS